jgi:uncharacterized membrane protein
MDCCANQTQKKSDEEIILDIKYAKGEITYNEYLRMKKDLNNNGVSD